MDSGFFAQCVVMMHSLAGQERWRFDAENLHSSIH